MYIVYRHTNKKNGKVYIGITCRTMKSRWYEGYRNNKYFHRAVLKYGWEGFYHEILEEGLTKEQAEEKERYYIKLHDSTDIKKGYNIELGGNSNGKHSEETKRKISESQKGRTFTEEHRRNLSKALKGKKRTPEQRQKASIALLGNHRTLGYKHTEETKAKMREAHKNAPSKPVLCITTGETFKSAKAAAEHFGLSRHKVLYNCTGKTKSIYGSNLTFAYK